MKGANTGTYVKGKSNKDETYVPSARGFKSPDPRDPYKRQVDTKSHAGGDEAIIARDRRIRRKGKITTSSGRYRVPIKKLIVKKKQRAQ